MRVVVFSINRPFPSRTIYNLFYIETILFNRTYNIYNIWTFEGIDRSYRQNEGTNVEEGKKGGG